MEIGMTIRKEILETSLILEGFTSAFLSALLGIKDYSNSRTLGNKGGCLSFNQKVDLLIEIGALSKTERSKFQTFMEIRNQFMHNISATTFEKCFTATKGKDTFVLRTYPQSNCLSREEQLQAASKELSNDIFVITTSLKNKVYDKVKNEVESDFAKKQQKAIFDSIEQVKTSLDNFFDEEIAKKSTFNSVRLKGFGTAISNMILNIWIKEFDRLISTEKKKTTPEYWGLRKNDS